MVIFSLKVTKIIWLTFRSFWGKQNFNFVFISAVTIMDTEWCYICVIYDVLLFQVDQRDYAEGLCTYKIFQFGAERNDAAVLVF